MSDFLEGARVGSQLTGQLGDALVSAIQARREQAWREKLQEGADLDRKRQIELEKPLPVETLKGIASGKPEALAELPRSQQLAGLASQAKAKKDTMQVDPKMAAEPWAVAAGLEPGGYPTSFVEKSRTAYKGSNNKEKTPREQKIIDDSVVAMGKDVDPRAFRSGGFGDSAKVFDRSERLEALTRAVDVNQRGNYDKRQIYEIANGVQSLLSGGNVAAVDLVREFVPHTLWGKVKDVQEWLTNNPTGRDQQDFAKRAMQTVANEKATTDAQIKRERFQRLSKWDHVRRNAPEAWENVVRSFEVDPREYDLWKKLGYQKMSAMTRPGEKETSALGSEASNNIEDLLKEFKGK